MQFYMFGGGGGWIHFRKSFRSSLSPMRVKTGDINMTVVPLPLEGKKYKHTNFITLLFQGFVGLFV